MSIDTSLLGCLCADVMGKLADSFGDNVTIRTAAIVVEVDSPESSVFWWDSTEDRQWVIAALLEETLDSIAALRTEMGREPFDRDDE